MSSSAPRLRWRQIGFLADALCWYLAITWAELLRFDLSSGSIDWAPLQILQLGVIVLQLILGLAFHVYTGRFLEGSSEQALALALSFSLTGLIATGGLLFIGKNAAVPASVVLSALPLALLLSLAVRFLQRYWSNVGKHAGTDATPTLIFGAGFIGSNLTRWMNSDDASPYLAVGLIDDDPEKRRIRISGVPVVGTLDSLPEAAKKAGAEVLVVAVANASSALMRKVHDQAKAADLQVKIMPVIGDVVAGKIQAANMRDLSVDDLIGRAVIDTNVAEIAGYLTDRRVLVTGAGGSIGSQLCLEIMKFGPRDLVMLDRDETALQAIDIEISGNGILQNNRIVLGDIRDREMLQKTFAKWMPEVVFHTAALKHLPLLERHPEEAWKTNVIGTLNVLQAAQAAGVGTFINISTDKAADPTSVLGRAKRVAEQLTAHAGMTGSGRYISVRFGNVIGSRGSMLPVFTRLIKEGKTLTITHPETTRYFMTIPEACQLVLQAGGIGRNGEVLILDMGEPVKILDIATRMIEMSGKDIDIVFTGLRPGEKLHEDLVGLGETEERPFHPLISHAQVEPLSPEDLDQERWNEVSGCSGGEAQ